jgi:transmembrane 9 superfamily protein 2/4
MVQDNNTCKLLCLVSDVNGKEAKFINDRIREDYALNWLVDGLPAAEMKIDLRTNDTFFDMGFNLGNNEGVHQNLPALNNHYEIVLKYHRPSPDAYRIVGVLVWPASIGGEQDSTPHCDITVPKPLVLSEDRSQAVRYTYRITWSVSVYSKVCTGAPDIVQESDTPWATRWDNYLHIFDPKIHWFSLFNSSAIVIFLCVMVSMILFRNISRDVRSPILASFQS